MDRPIDLTPSSWTLSKWLAVQTDTARNSIVACIESHQPTRTDRSCRILLNAHLRFYEVVEPVYRDTNLRSMFFSFLAERKVASFEFQRDELEKDLPSSSVTKRAPGGLIPRIGWLYATEFVERGLTRLLAETQPSFAVLNINSEGSTVLWKRFRDHLDSLDFSESDEHHLARSACSALVSYSDLFSAAFRVADD